MVMDPAAVEQLIIAFLSAIVIAFSSILAVFVALWLGRGSYGIAALLRNPWGWSPALLALCFYFMALHKSWSSPVLWALVFLSIRLIYTWLEETENETGDD